MDATLVILAAGIGTKYGGLKQLEPLGPGGETLLEYSIFDARRAGSRLGQTFSGVGPVSRGLCQVDVRGWLERIVEVPTLRTADGAPCPRSAREDAIAEPASPRAPGCQPAMSHARMEA
jgi:hypothetical protein